MFGFYVYLICQWEAVVGLHSNCEDILVTIDDGVGHRSQGGVANLQTHTSNIPHTLGHKIHIMAVTQCSKKKVNVSLGEF